MLICRIYTIIISKNTNTIFMITYNDTTINPHRESIGTLLKLAVFPHSFINSIDKMSRYKHIFVFTFTFYLLLLKKEQKPPDIRNCRSNFI